MTTTNPLVHAVRLGVRRGWLECVQSVRSSQDQWFYLITALLTLGYLWLRRNSDSGVPGVPFAAVTLPSLLAALIVFGMVIGPAYSIAMEKEDGTVLRHRAVPYGLAGYFTGQLVYQSLNLIPQLIVVLVPSLLLFDNLMSHPTGWLTVAWVVLLSLLAALPIGMLIGALVPSVQKVGSWGMLPIMVMVGISGVFFPIQAMWGWLQGVAQVLPLYWIGLGMRSAFLPDAAAAAEIGGSWRTLETVAVLGAWALVGAVAMPRFLRRMSRRQTGSQVQAARDATLQWVR